MIRFCRLADRRGGLTGDLNRTQNVMLQAMLAYDQKESGEKELRYFERMMIAANPDRATQIHKMFASQEEQAQDEWNQVPEEEVADISEDEEVSNIVDQLRQFGMVDQEV